MVSESELSIEEITKSIRIVVDTRCEFVVYSETELKAKEVDLMCRSSYYENVAPMGEVTTAAREQISETRFTGIDFCKYLLELGFEDFSPALSKNKTLKIFVKREEHSLTVELDSANRYAFSGGRLQWPLFLPKVGVYAVWHRNSTLIYCGIYCDDELTIRKPGFNNQVTSRRLGSILFRHRSGDRSSDRFSLKVCDRLVLPELSEVDFRIACQNDYMFDNLTQKFIRDNLSFSFVATGTVTKAKGVVGEIYAGSLGFEPILTPIKE